MVDSDSPGYESASPQTSRRGKGRRQGGAAGSGRSKPRASLACMNCRQRKIKCNMDAIGNPCSPCRQAETQCVVTRDGDRRKAGSRQQVTALQDRLQHLENIVVAQGRNATGASHEFLERYEEQHDERPDRFSHQRRATEPALSNFDMSDLTMSQLQQQHQPQDDLAFNGGFSTSFVPERSDDMHEAASDILPPAMGRLTPPSEKDSPRLAADEDNGSALRFYGPTSQRYLTSRSLPDDNEPSSGLQQDIAVVSIDSGAVRDRLLQTFWNAQQLSQPLVDQISFEAERRKSTRSQYYSAFLEDAILATASRMSTSFDIRTLGPQFAEQATSQIVQELSNPNIASIQGFLVLSDYEATRGRDRLGYLYCGIACRMVFDFGLQESCNDSVAIGKLSPSEILSRHFLFLGAYVYDKIWSMYLGRPSSMANSLLLTAQRRAAEQGWAIPPTLDAWVGLCTDISDVAEILNNGTPLDWSSMDRLQDLDAKIKRRCEALPPSLALDEKHISDLPVEVYGLHIQFRGIRIVLHRLLSRAVVQASPQRPGPADESLQRSRMVMHENAICIARLAFVYQQIFGIENIITIMLDNMFVAAAVLCSHVIRTQQKDQTHSSEQDIQWLRYLADMLKNAQKHYPVTARMRTTLSVLVDGTSLAGMFGQWKQIPSAQMPTSGPSRTDFMGLGQHMYQQPTAGGTAPMAGSFGEEFPNISPNMDMTNWMSWNLSSVD